MTTQRCWTNQRITPRQSTTHWCWRPPTNRNGNESPKPDGVKPDLTNSRPRCCKLRRCGTSAATKNHEVAQCRVVVLEEARSEPRRSKPPQFSVGGGDGGRQRTETVSQPEEPVMKRRQRKRQSQVAEKEHRGEELGRGRVEDLRESHSAEQSDRSA